MNKFCWMLILSCFFVAPVAAQSAEIMVLPATKPAMQPVGSGKYTKFGFSIYRVTLWAPAGQWQVGQPYALELHYARDLDKETVVNAVYENIREQKVADMQTLGQWKGLLEQTIPAVKEGDVIVALAMPGQPSQLYFNSESLGYFSDQRLSDAFFGIWLGEKANVSLKRQLLNL